MTVNTTDFHSWQKASDAEKAKFNTSSPNLCLLRDYLLNRWGGASLGIYEDRPIRGVMSTVPSSHAFGAALDYRYDNREEAEGIIRWLISNSKELGVQAIHDYYGCAIWRSTNSEPDKGGWESAEKSQNTGMGQPWAQWLHIETTKTDWGNNTPIEERGVTELKD
jgi:hypothetical protein